MTDAKSCACKSVDAHVEQMSSEDEEAEVEASADEAGEREWEAHTEAYKDAFAGKYEELSSSKSDPSTEAEMQAWIDKHHPLLCCDKRHKNRRFMLDGVGY